jgi:hypothetical protein
MTAFESNKTYGNDLTIKVISRTEKTLTIETTAWGTKRVKVREYQKGVEAIYFKAWIITADEIFNAEEARQIAYERAYN